jgi:secondary thiamine-phosphate synthase enzyme
METREIELSSPRRGLVDVTGACVDFAREASGGDDGILHLFLPHATAGLVVMELGSGSDADLMDALDRLLPRDDRWRHRHGSAGHDRHAERWGGQQRQHVVGTVAGRLALGTWQSIAVVDPNADNPRRRLRLSFLRG